MRACTRSPGIASATSTTWPSTRAIIRPPAAGFSIERDRLARVSMVSRPSCSLHSRARVRPRTRHSRYAIVGSPKRSRTRRSIAASRARANASAAIPLRNPASSSSASRASDAAAAPSSARARLLQQLRVEGRQAIDQRLTRLAPQAARLAPGPRRAPRHAIDERVELGAERPARARGRQPEHDALEMFRQRLTSTARLTTAV